MYEGKQQESWQQVEHSHSSSRCIRAKRSETFNVGYPILVEFDEWMRTFVSRTPVATVRAKETVELPFTNKTEFRDPQRSKDRLADPLIFNIEERSKFDTKQCIAKEINFFSLLLPFFVLFV